MQLLVINMEKDDYTSMIFKELEKEYDTYATFVTLKEKDLKIVSEFDIVIIKSNSLEELQEILKYKEIEDVSKVLVTDNMDEKFIWNASPYFMDIISEIKSSEYLMRRLYALVYQYEQ